MYKYITERCIDPYAALNQCFVLFMEDINLLLSIIIKFNVFQVSKKCLILYLT